MTMFMSQWFALYVVIDENNNAPYHLAKLDGTRLVVLIVCTRVEIFEKWEEDEQVLGCLGEEDHNDEQASGHENIHDDDMEEMKG